MATSAKSRIRAVRPSQLQALASDTISAFGLNRLIRDTSKAEKQVSLISPTVVIAPEVRKMRSQQLGLRLGGDQVQAMRELLQSVFGRSSGIIRAHIGPPLVTRITGQLAWLP